MKFEPYRACVPVEELCNLGETGDPSEIRVKDVEQYETSAKSAVVQAAGRWLRSICLALV